MNNPKSIERVLEIKPKLVSSVRGLPSLGTRLDGNAFSNEVAKIYNSFELYGNELYKLDNEKNINIPNRSLGGGSQMVADVFPPCKKAMIDSLNQNNFSEYPMAAGDEEARKTIVEYFKFEGVTNNNTLNVNNVIFTVSTTQAFEMVMKAIARPYDVILMTGPNYGLFTFIPERSTFATVEILNLSSEDDWYVNPEKLAARIDEINKELKEQHANTLSYTPKVVAFLNVNPHNPLGKVMNEKNSYLLEAIGDICLEKGVFVIDDMIYRDLTFDRDNLAKPMASYDKFFDNTILITGLSKSYGLAAMRTGMILGSDIIVRDIRNQIFQRMDSTPVLQATALAGAFNPSKERYDEYNKYFKPLIDEYKYRLQLLKSMIEGINSIDDLELRKMIESDIMKMASSDFSIDALLEGIPGVKFVEKAFPESGFFVLLDFTDLKSKTSENGRIITSESELLKHMYEEEKLKLILGQSISWPNKEELIGRVTTALPREDIVGHFGAMNRCLRKLK